MSLYPEAPERLSLDGFASFKGVVRRQQVLHACDRHVVIEDFGHHPTAMEHTLLALKARYPGKRVLACFEPRSNTICSGIFQKDLAQSLSAAQDVYIGPIHRAKKWSAQQCLDTQRICTDLADHGVRARTFESNSQLLDALRQDHQALQEEQTPTLVCFFSNGSFDGVMHKFVENGVN
ncbi:MAG: hypothetical protein B7X06_02435 [Verrucomicrobia bacterium 21-51-4]|nr:MAG: hypothetical protein B7X06_02435 [Verrucomicrobia bacterium 21-51-4]